MSTGAQPAGYQPQSGERTAPRELPIPDIPCPGPILRDFHKIKSEPCPHFTSIYINTNAENPLPGA
jgi:hypothetical protein